MMQLFIVILVASLSTSLCNGENIVDFELSMQRHTKALLIKNELFYLTKELYEKYAPEMLTPSNKLLIPKIIHQIWLGSPVPQALKKYMRSWQKIHPDWQYILWTDADVESFPMQNREIFNKAQNYGQRSDIWRYEILCLYGGVYVDVDFKCLKRFDILHHCFDFYSGLFDNTCCSIANGIIGSYPGHPLLKKIISAISDKSISPKDDFQNIIDKTGPRLLTNIFIENAKDCAGKNIILPCTFFYPSPNTARYLSPEKQDAYIKPESFGVHYWTCTWQKPSAFVKN